MRKNIQTDSQAVRFRHFANRPYAVFSSLNRQVSIGVLGVMTLTFAHVETISAQTENKEYGSSYELGEVQVTGTRAPLTVSQDARMVTVLDRKAIASIPAQSVNDLLKYAVGVDVRQRGDMGVQTDISIRGGTFDQIAILLNGVNICDPQTGHNTADFPVDVHDIERIEVLEGPAGRVYGTSSLVGAINIVTRVERRSGGELYADAGSYGFANGGGRFNLTKGRVSNQLSGSYTRSDGYSRNAAGRLNAQFQRGRAFYQGKYAGSDLKLNWFAGFTNKDYGANTFYSAKYDDQYEHTRKYFAAVQAETKGRYFQFKPSAYWNRSEDRFELIHNRPDQVPYNYHRSDVYGLNLNNCLETSLGKTAFGAEFRNEGIVSTNLGEPLNTPKPAPGGGEYQVGLNRTNISFHLEHNVLLGRFTLSAGVMAIKNTGNEMNFNFYPGVDASYRIGSDWKIYASYNTSLRMPTFTELYYSVGGHQADKYLKPEKMSAVEAGVKYLTPGVRGTLNLYYHHGTDMIDWIRDVSQGEDAPWQSVNHTKINTLGVEASVLLDFSELVGREAFVRNVSVAYSHIHQDKETTPNIQSRYALEHLRNKLVAQAQFHVWSRLNLNLACRWMDRVGTYQSGDALKEYDPYTLLDARLSWDASNYSLYAEANNLLNKTYYDHGNIPQPGIWVRAGARWKFSF